MHALVLIALPLAVTAAVTTARPDRCLVPASIRDALLNGISGEEAYRHVEFLAANRNRQVSEYLDTFFETTYITRRLAEYGTLGAKVDYCRSDNPW